MLYKNHTGGIKDFDFKSRIVTGYLNEFGSKDHDGDIVLKTSFDKTLTERKDNVWFLNQHNWAQPHGKFKELYPDSKGLYFESNPLSDTTYSNDALKLYDAGIMNEHSFGYKVMKSHYDKEAKANILTELKLYEGSNVTLGANPNTPFTGFKHLDLKQTQSEIKKFLKAFRNGTFTDDTFGLLEIAINQLHKHAFELGKKSLVEEPINITLNGTDLKNTLEDTIKRNESLGGKLNGVLNEPMNEQKARNIIII